VLFPRRIKNAFDYRDNAIRPSGKRRGRDRAETRRARVLELPFRNTTKAFAAISRLSIRRIRNRRAKRVADLDDRVIVE